MEIKLSKTSEDADCIHCHGISVKKSHKLPNGHYWIGAEDFIKQLDVPITPAELIVNHAIGKNERKGISRILLKIKLLLKLKILKILLKKY